MTDTAAPSGDARDADSQRERQVGALRLHVRRALVDLGMAQKDLARRIGMSEAVLSHFLTGRRKALRPAERAAIVRELGPALAAAQASAVAPVLAAPGLGARRQRLVPVYPVGAGYEIAFGDGEMPVGESIEDPVATDVPDPNAFGGRVVGSSMEAEGGGGFREGDTVVFDTKAEVRDGSFCLVRFADEGSTFKQIYREGGSIRLHPLNPAFDDETHPLSAIHALYRAVRHVRKI